MAFELWVYHNLVGNLLYDEVLKVFEDFEFYLF